MPTKDTPKIDEKWFSATDEEMRELIRDCFPKKAKSAEPKCKCGQEICSGCEACMFEGDGSCHTCSPVAPIPVPVETLNLIYEQTGGAFGCDPDAYGRAVEAEYQRLNPPAEPKCAGLKDRIRALDAELIADGVTMITHRPAEPDATDAGGGDDDFESCWRGKENE